MTPKFSLIVATVGAALVVGVPAAWGDNYFADRQDAAAGVSPDVVDRAVAAKQNSLSSVLDARERALSVGREQQSTSMLDGREEAFRAKLQIQLSNGISPDAFERAVQARGSTVDGFIANDDRFRTVPTNEPAPVEVTSSGNEIEWHQVGIGLGAGIALMLGLYLVLKSTRTRRLAH